MKKDLPIILGGIAVGAIVVWYLTKPDSRKSRPVPEGREEDLDAGVVALGAPTQVIQGQAGTQPSVQTTNTTTTQNTPAPPPPPYALVEINPMFQGTSAYTDMFGGCDFPLLPESESVCVKRLQDAFDVEKTGVFDDATQVALDDFIEKMPNRTDGHFSRFTREGCIAFDPVSGQSSNVCGLNHDQYLEILFKMGIPLTETYDA